MTLFTCHSHPLDTQRGNNAQTPRRPPSDLQMPCQSLSICMVDRYLCTNSRDNTHMWNVLEIHNAVERAPHTVPSSDRPWQKVEMDLFEWANKTYLLVIDYFSQDIQVAELRVTSSEATVRAVKEAFAHNGYPVTIVSDNGPQFSSVSFRTFAK